MPIWSLYRLPDASPRSYSARTTSAKARPSPFGFSDSSMMGAIIVIATVMIRIMPPMAVARTRSGATNPVAAELIAADIEAVTPLAAAAPVAVADVPACAVPAAVLPINGLFTFSTAFVTRLEESPFVFKVDGMDDLMADPAFSATVVAADADSRAANSRVADTVL